MLFACFLLFLGIAGATVVDSAYGCACVLVSASDSACKTQTSNQTTTYGFTTCNRYKLSNGNKRSASLTSDCATLTIWDGELCAGTPATTFNTQTSECKQNPFDSSTSYWSWKCTKTAAQTFDNSKHCAQSDIGYSQKDCTGVSSSSDKISSQLKGTCDKVWNYNTTTKGWVMNSYKVADDCSKITQFKSADCSGTATKVVYENNRCQNADPPATTSVKEFIAPRPSPPYGCNCIVVDYTDSTTCQSGNKNFMIADPLAGFGTCESATDGTKKNAWSISEDCSTLKIWENKLTCDGEPSKTEDVTTHTKCQPNRDPTIGGSFTMRCEKTPAQTYDKTQMCKMTSLEYESSNKNCTGDAKKTSISFVVKGSCFMVQNTFQNNSKTVVMKTSIKIAADCTKGDYYGNSTDCGVTGDSTSSPVYQKGKTTQCFQNTYGVAGRETIYVEPVASSDSDGAVKISAFVGLTIMLFANLFF